MKTLEERVKAGMVKTDSDLDENLMSEMFAFLDALRDSGEINMMGARPHIIEEFDIDSKDAKAYLMAWMGAF